MRIVFDVDDDFDPSEHVGHITYVRRDDSVVCLTCMGLDEEKDQSIPR